MVVSGCQWVRGWVLGVVCVRGGQHSQVLETLETSPQEMVYGLVLPGPFPPPCIRVVSESTVGCWYEEHIWVLVLRTRLLGTQLGQYKEHSWVFVLLYILTFIKSRSEAHTELNSYPSGW